MDSQEGLRAGDQSVAKVAGGMVIAAVVGLVLLRKLSISVSV